MNREEKTTAIETLKETVGQYENFYVTDASTLTVEEVNKLRRLCFEKGIHFEVVKNTLLRKALETYGDKYEKLYEVLHGPTSVMFCESLKAPAHVIRDFRKGNEKGKPVLKGAFIHSDVFLGDESLEQLANLRTKEELIGDIIAMLQSPAKNVISALLSGENKLAGIVKTLSEKEDNA